MSYNDNILRRKLEGRLGKDDLKELAQITKGEENNIYKEELYSLVKDTDVRISYNALWVFTHFDAQNNKWLFTKHDELIDLVMKEEHEGKKRLLLTVLLKQPFVKEELRGDFIDYCLSVIISSSCSHAVRVLCIKLAYKQCKYYPELLGEMERVLEMLYDEPLPASLLTARRNILKRIK